ncbi:hypothetical protein QSI_0424 [Clostridioides difficile P28]|nr:hypothetical protein QSI_0424 [Clostridioides difficile P28]
MDNRFPSYQKKAAVKQSKRKEASVSKSFSFYAIQTVRLPYL